MTDQPDQPDQAFQSEPTVQAELVAGLRGSVRRLRELHHQATGADRTNLAALLGTALQDLAVKLDDDDPDLPAFCREGLAMLAEIPAGGFLDQARLVLRTRLTVTESTRQPVFAAADPLARRTNPALPDAEPPNPVPPDPASPPPSAVVAARAMAGKLIIPGGFSLAGDPAQLQQFRQLVAMARTAQDTLPPDHPMVAQTRVLIGFSDGMEALASGQWTKDNETTLAQLRRDAAASTVTTNPQLSAMVRPLLAMLAVARAHVKEQSPNVRDHLNAEELDELIAELEAAGDQLTAQPVPGGEQFPQLLRFFAGYFLVLRAGRGGGERTGRDEPPDPDPERAELLDRARRYLRQGPPEFAEEARLILSSLERPDGPGADPSPEFIMMMDRFPDHAPVGQLTMAMAKAERARQTRSPEDFAEAITGLRAGLKRLPTGHPMQPAALSALTNVLALRGSLTQSPQDIAEAMSAGLSAVRAAEEPSLEVTGHLVGVLTSALMLDLRDGPFAQAEDALADALAKLGPDQPQVWLRVNLHTGLGSARLLRWRVAHDSALRASARSALDQAQRLLPPAEPADRWLGAAWTLLGANTAGALFGADPAAADAARRLIEQLESLLGAHPDLAGRLAGQTVPGGLAGMGLVADGPGMVRALAQMKAVLPGAAAGFGAEALARPDINRHQVEQVMKQMRAGQGPGFDVQAMMQSPQGMMDAVVQLMKSDPDAVNAVLGAFTGQQVAPPPPSPHESARRVRQGLERAYYTLRANALGTGPRPALSPLDPPDPLVLLVATAELRAGLAAGLRDADLVHQAHGVLGLALAELHRLAHPDPEAAGDLDETGRATANGDPGLLTLLAAIHHLDLALSSDVEELPSIWRAELLHLQARCYRTLSGLDGLRTAAARFPTAGQDAERTARTALTELTRCVLLSEHVDDALQIAVRANEIVARAVGWCLADNRIEAAIEVAEGGRSLVLGSVVLSGRVEDMLTAEKLPDVAAAWRTGSAQGRLAGLRAISRTFEGHVLLTPPTITEISKTLWSSAADFDAIVYLIPGRAVVPGSGVDHPTPGHALLVRSNFTVEAVELPGAVIGPAEPVAEYLSAFANALTALQSNASGKEGFKGGPDGQNWAQQLDRIGAWAHRQVIGPLIRHTAGWGLDHVPHLTLIALGELAAVPYTAAWTPEDQGSGRRYAIQDLVLSFSVSARMLIDVARRPRPGDGDGVVLVGDATGHFPFSRAIARELRAQYAEAGGADSVRLYGRRENERLAPDGIATTERILAALLGDGAGGRAAALLHLGTHGVGQPDPRLQTADDWLRLATILTRARGRDRSSPGGLVITCACLTDSTDRQYDEAMTLATALLTAGAGGVIGTRWPIDDQINAVFALHLHDRLRKDRRRRSPAHALREAQLAMLDPACPKPPGLIPGLADLGAQRLSHPASWAGYVHHGC